MSNAKDVILSKKLSRILRHKAKEENLEINEEGYIGVTDILNHKSFKGIYKLEDIQRVVANNDKKRFTIRVFNGKLEICANQGHSIVGLNKLNLIPITVIQPFGIVHGTYFNCWNIIKIEGLSRMSRNHIHFAKDLLDKDLVISGMRKNCQVYIYINQQLALADGIPFFLSVNEVVLSPGNERGLIEPNYFAKVCDFRGQLLK